MVGRIARGGWGVFVVVMMGAVFGGCVHQSGGRIAEGKLWQERGGTLGKVKVIVVGEKWNASDEHVAAVNAAAREVLGKLPGTTVVAAEKTKGWDAAVGDGEAIAAGKAEGAQTVCVMDVGTFGGMFWIGLPEVWGMETRVLYSLRVLDVATGELVMACVSYRQTGGAWEFCDPTDAAGSLRTMLMRDLRVPKGGH